MAGKNRKVHHYTEADNASGGRAAAPVEGQGATAQNFIGGIMSARKRYAEQPNISPNYQSGQSPDTLDDVCPGVFGEGFCKPG